MKPPLWFLFIGWTLGGLALPFFDRGAFGWWDMVWVVLFTVAAYAGIAARAGLSSARVCAGVVIVSFTAVLAAAELTGLLGLHFTPQVGLGMTIGVPLLPLLLLFAILSVSERTAAVVIPYAGRAGHAAWTALGFSVSAVNGAAFLAKSRTWWVGNPGGDGWMGAVAVTALLALIAFGLSFVYPTDSRIRRTRWSVEVAAWLAINLLFLAANFAILLQ